jgi:hypothetical protein
MVGTHVTLVEKRPGKDAAGLTGFGADVLTYVR